MKYRRTMLLIIAILLIFSATVLATGTTFNGYPVINLKLNGQLIQPQPNDVPPVLMDGRVMIPVRLASEALGVTVLWDEGTQSVLLVKSESQPKEEVIQPLPSSMSFTKIQLDSTNRLTGRIMNKNSYTVNAKFTVDFYKQGEYLGHVHGEVITLLGNELRDFALVIPKEVLEYTTYTVKVDTVVKI